MSPPARLPRSLSSCPTLGDPGTKLHKSKPTFSKSEHHKPDPTLVPLPPSPPATDTLEELEPVKPSRSAGARKRSVAPQAYPSARSARFLSGSKSSGNGRKRVRDPFGSESPPSSPTTRKSLNSSSDPIKSNRGKKKPKVDQLPPSPTALRTSPRNPFLVKPGEEPRRAGCKAEDGHRKLVYVFRGKRIQYDSAEDLDGPCGDSPFALSKPKLLFPSPPSPKSTPSASSKLHEHPITGLMEKSFQTPKKPVPASSFFPTPQSRPSRNRVDRLNQPPTAKTSKSIR